MPDLAERLLQKGREHLASPIEEDVIAVYVNVPGLVAEAPTPGPAESGRTAGAGQVTGQVPW